MREIYLVDRNSRMRAIIASDSFGAETDVAPLGIGFYSCTRNMSTTENAGKSTRGVTFSTTPVFLRDELLAEILAGRHSPVSQEFLLLGSAGLGTDSSVHAQVLVQRWILLGLQPLQELLMQNVPLLEMNRRLLQTDSLAAGIHIVFERIFEKIMDIRPQVVVIPVDSAILVDFFVSILGKLPFGLGLSEPAVGLREEVIPLTPIEREICSHRVSEEIVRWIAQSGHDIQVIFKCENSRHLNGLSSICRAIKATGSNRQVIFKV